MQEQTERSFKNTEYLRQLLLLILQSGQQQKHEKAILNKYTKSTVEKKNALKF